jgi:predicted short-subunit dehydrogenase-like oxidoreductase (DUF2520 family)
VGSGRAAASLGRSFVRAGHRVVIARRGASAESLAAALSAEVMAPAAMLAVADVTFLAVPDRLIGAAAAELARQAPVGAGRLVVHLSGSVGPEALQALAGRGYAVGAIHPLQVLSGWRIPPGTTFAIEADPAALPLLSQLVADLNGVEIALPPGARVRYHAAAVVAANLGMALLAEAVDLMASTGVDRRQALDGLAGLVRGGLEASLESGLPQALTGPIVRGDVETVRRHLDAIAADPDLLAAYRAASRLALRQARSQGRPTDLAATELAALLAD